MKKNLYVSLITHHLCSRIFTLFYINKITNILDAKHYIWDLK